MRIRGAKQELIEAGEDTEGMVESTSQLRDLVKGLTGFDIMADEAGTQFKDIYDIVVGIGEKWNELSDIDQAGLLEALAGKMQGNALAAALGNIDTIKKVYQTAEFESDGSAQRENAAYLDSVSGKLGQLKLSWESLSTTFLTSDFLKFGIEQLTSLATTIDSVVSSIGSLGTVMVGLNIGSFFKNFNQYKNMGLVANSVSMFGNPADIDGIAAATQHLSVQNTVAALSYTELSAAQQVEILTKKGVNQAIAQEIVANQSLSTANRIAASSQSLLNKATTSLSSAFKGLGMAIKSNPLFFIITGIGLAISLIDKAVSNVKEAREEVIAAGEEAVETGNKIYELASSYITLSEAVKNGSASSDSLINAQSEIISALNLTGLSVDELIEKYGSLEQAIISASETEMERQIRTAKQGINAMKEEAVSELDTWDYKNTVLTMDYLGDEEARHQQYEIASALQKKFESVVATAPDIVSSDADFKIELPNIDAPISSLNYEDYVENYEYLREVLSFIENSYGSKNEIYRTLNNMFKKYENIIEPISDEADLINTAIAKKYLLSFESEYKQGDIKNLEKLKARIIESAKKDEEFDNVGASTIESIVEAILIENDRWGNLAATFYSQQDKLAEKKQKSESVIKNVFGNNPMTLLGSLDELKKFNSQLKGLSPEDLEIAYKISAEADYDSFDELLVGIEKFKQSGQSVIDEADKISFSSLFAESEDGNAFVEGIDSHIEKVNTLKEAWASFQKGDFSETAFVELIKQFPELADNADDLDTAIVELLRGMDNDIAEKFKSQLKYMDTEEDRIALENLYQTILKLSDVSDISIDINVETEKFSNLYSALSESVSATGMTSESVKKVNAIFSELEGYDPSQLFERTENGIHMNVDALRNLQKQYDIQKKQDIDSHLKNLQSQYEGLTDQINKATSSSERAKLISQRDNLADDITAVADLATQYDGLTSAYNRWIQAQSDDNERSMYEGIIGGKETIDDLISRGWAGSDEVRSYIDLISAEDLSNATVEEVMKAYEKIGQEIGNSGYSLWDFLTVDEDGNSTSEGGYRFFDTVKDVLGETYAWIDKNGFYNFDFGQGKDEDVAKALGMDVEYLQSILRAMSDAGFKIHLDAEYSDIENFIADAETARDAWKSLIKLSEEGKIDFDISSIDLNATDIDSITSQIENVQGLLSDFRNVDGTINTEVEGAEELKTILIDLITKKQELNAPVFMSIDSSQLDSETSEAIELLKELWRNYDEIEINTALGVDTSIAQGNIRELVLQISNLSPELRAKLGLDDTEFMSAVGRLQASIHAGVDINPTDLEIVRSTVSSMTPDMMIEAGIDDSEVQEYDPNDKQASVQYSVNEIAIKMWTPPTKTGIARYTPTLNSYTVPTLYGNLVLKTSGNAKHEGTAFSQGNWGIKGSGVALGGELGMEILVRDGKYYTIGENSAEFFKYQPNDIIFNAEQSRELLEKGKITRSKKRGKAFADGTVPSSGKAFSRGGGGMARPSFSTTTTTTTTSSSNNSSSNSSNSSSSEATEEAEEFLETIDWIEIAIDRIERAIDTLDLKASSTYRDWSIRNKALTDEIGMISDEIDLQQKAYTRYMQEANSVGLSADYATKVQNGTIDIEKITDEALHEQIENYQTWFEKAIDCRDAVDELTDSLSECYKVAFDNIITQYEGIFSRIELEKNLLEEYIGQAETKGYIVSVKYYQLLMANERDNIKQLQKQKIELETSMENALKNGAIKRGSEEWNNMSEEIRNVTSEIEQGNSALVEYAKNIQNIKWETFDFIQERVSNLSTETQFLINLLSNSELYTDKGQFTSEGKSVAGLHAVDYNTYMSQADDYAQEMQKINAELAKDPANIELEKRRDELFKLQQESIMAAEDEKQAIVDMVKEGIELELSSLQDLIDAHNEALDSAKDLYDYQNKVKEQTSEISSLQKQLQAYSGDTSEETRTTIQKLQVSLADAEQSLEETQYDKYISDSKKMMDSLYLDYETTLNKRLDNIDGLISDIITSVNNSQVEIASTLYSAVDKVGYTMSEATTAIWGKAYETTQAENQKRLEQVQSVVNKLEESKSLANTDANSILAAIGNGNIQNADDTIEIIKRLTANGDITTNMRDELLSSLNVNNPKTALESLGLIGTLEESGKLSHDDANALREAVATGNTSNSGHLASITQKLIENGALSTSQAAGMISAITGTNETNIASALKAIDTLVKDNQLSEYEAHTLMTSLVDGNAKNLESSANIIGGLIANGKIEAENAADIISAFNGSATANENISSALQTIDELSKSKKLTDEEINTLVGGLMGGDTTGLSGIISQLMVNKDITVSQAAGIIAVINDGKTHIVSVKTALDSMNNLLKTGKISISESQDIIDGLIGNSERVSETISTLVSQEGFTSKVNDIISALAGANTAADVSNLKTSLNKIDTLLSTGQISISEAGDIVDGLIGNGTDGISGIISRLVSSEKISSETASNLLGFIVKSNNSALNQEGQLSAIYSLISEGKISHDEAQIIIDGILGNKNASINGIINELIQNGQLSVRQAAAICSAVSNSKPQTSKIEKSFEIVNTLLAKGKVSIAEAQAIINALLGNKTDGLNGIIENLTANGVLTSREASNICASFKEIEANSVSELIKGLRDIISNYTDDFSNIANATNDALKEIKSILGDVNQDLSVDVRDLSAFSVALSSGKSDTLTSAADVDNDGKINVRDLAALSKQLSSPTLKSYATGVKNLSKDQLAWTQENGKLEYVIRPSDGAILTPLAKNDSVLNASASSNLWSVANNPEQFIRDNLGLSAILTPTVQKSTENTYNGDMNFSVTLPNVQNYEQFKYAMQRDKSFERFIRSVSVDRLFGKSSISKYKT